jgi:hypothetical protein
LTILDSNDEIKANKFKELYNKDPENGKVFLISGKYI